MNRAPVTTKWMAGPCMICMVCMICVVAIAFAGSAMSVEGAPSPRKKRLPVARVVTELVAEAKTTWDTDLSWPRIESDAATQLGEYEVLEMDVLASLGRPLHRHGAMDGYVKWQLLSFQPDLTKANEGILRRIIEAMPDPVSQVAPPPPPREDEAGGSAGLTVGTQTAFVAGAQAVPGTRLFRPVIGVIKSGSFIDPQGYVAINPHQKKFSAIGAVEQLHAEQDAIALANEPTFAYRDQMIEALPREGGFKLLAMLKDVYARLEAGDDSAIDAMSRLLGESRSLSDDLAMTRATYRQIQATTQLLKRVRTKVLVDMKVTDDGDHTLDVREIFFPPARWEALQLRVEAQGQFVPR